MPQVLLATRNAGKLRELRQLTAGLPIVWRGLIEFAGIPDAREDGSTFAENARRKALHYAQATGLYTLADDSGLEVDALAGAPGVLSARYAGRLGDAAASDMANNRKLLEALAGVPLEKRTARFRCAMAFARPTAVLCESAGVLEGVIGLAPSGQNGFGYDPLFLITDLGRTLAELPAEQKNAISHRGRALRAILPQIQAHLRCECQWTI